MQDIVFEKLRIENFRRYDSTEVDFPNGLTAIIGPNGAGKSTYFMAVMAVLYGRTAEGIELPDLVNKKVGKNLCIELTMRIDGNLHMFRRAYKHKKFKDKLFIYKDWNFDTKTGIDLTEKTNRETYAKISNLLVPREVFLNTIYFSQQVKDFFTALTDSKQKDIFDAILQLKEWGEYGEVAKEKAKEVNDDILRTEGESGHILSVIPEKEATIATIKESLENQHRIRKAEIENAENLVEKTKVDIAMAKKAIEDHGFSEEDMNAKQAEFVKTETEIEKIKSDAESEEKRLDASAKANQDKLDGESEKIKLEKQAELKEDFSKFKDEKKEIEGGILKERNEAISGFDKHLTDLEFAKSKKSSEIDRQQNQARKELSDLKNELNPEALKANTQSELSKLEGRKALLKSESDTVKDKVQAELTAQKDLDDKKSELEESLNQKVIICKTCGQEVKDYKHIQKIKDQIDQYGKQIEESKAIEQILRQQFEKIKGDFQSIQKQAKVVADKGNKQLADIEEKISEKENSTQARVNDLDKELREFLAAHERKKLAVSEDKSEIEEEFRLKLVAIEDEIVSKADGLKAEFAEFAKEESDRVEKEKIKVSLKLTDDKNKVNKEAAEATIKIQKKLDVLQQELRDFRNSRIIHSELTNKVTSLQERLSNIQLQLENLQKSTIDDSALKSAKEDFKKAKEKAVEIEKELNTKRKQFKILEFWKEGFSDRGIPSMLIDSSIPFMNKAIREELEKIVPGRFMVSFDTLSETKSGQIREKFSVNILNLETGADRHDLLSGGEKRIIDVCCLRVLRLLAENLYQKKFNITFFDEVLDSIDSENSRTFCAALRKLAGDQNITLISHAVDKIGEVDRVLRM